MNRDRLAGKWVQLTGKLKQRWARMRRDPRALAAAQYEQLMGRIRERHGIAKDHAAEEAKAFLSAQLRRGIGDQAGHEDAPASPRGALEAFLARKRDSSPTD